MRVKNIIPTAKSGNLTEIYDLDPNSISSIAVWMYIHKYGLENWKEMMNIDFDITDFTIRVQLNSINEINKLKSYLCQKSGISICSNNHDQCAVVVSNPPVSTQDFAQFREWRASLPWETEMHTRVTFPTTDVRDHFERAHALWQAAQ